MSRRATLGPNDLALLRLPSEPRLSPDGRTIVFVEQRVDWDRDAYRRGLRRIDVETGRIEPWTEGAQLDQSPAWMPDSRSVVFVSDRGGSEGLWRTSGREAQLLVRLPGKIRSPRPSPDGRSIAFLYTPTPPPTTVRRIVRHGYKHDGRGFRDGAFTHVWTLDLSTRRARPITSGDFDDLAFDWSPDGKRIVFVSNRIPRADIDSLNTDLFVVSSRGGRARPLTKFRGLKHSPAWSPDGRTIAFVGNARFPDAVDVTHVWTMPASGGRARDLMAHSELDCSDTLLTDLENVLDNPPAPVWSADGERLFALASQEGAVDIWEIDARTGARKRRSFGRHGLRGLSQSRDGRRWAFVRRDATEPGDVWVAEPSARASASTPPNPSIPGAQLRRLTAESAALRKVRHLIQPEPFELPSPAGHSVRGWMLRARTTKRRAPLILMIHGGPYAMYGWSFMHEFQVLAQNGYHVAALNVRGSTGYGRDYLRALVGTWGSRDFEDVMRVTDSLERLPFVDPSRIALAGGSYGGYLTAWTIAHTPRFATAVAMRGVYNFPSMFGSSDIGPELLHEFENQPPWESIDRWWRVSPIAQVKKVRTPLLLLHADEDHRCPVSQAEEMFNALRVLGRDVELVRFAGEGHDLSRSGKPHHRVARLEILLDWFDRKL